MQRKLHPITIEYLRTSVPKCYHTVVSGNRCELCGAELAASCQSAPQLNMEQQMHLAVSRLLVHFRTEDPPGDAHGIAQACQELAERVAVAAPVSPETTVGLRKLLEAKDCFARAIKWQESGGDV